MKKRDLLLVLVLGLLPILVVVGLAMLVKSPPSPGLMVPADLERPQGRAAWDKLMGPPPPMPTPDIPFLDSLKPTLTTDTWKVEYPDRSGSDSSIANYTVERLPAPVAEPSTPTLRLWALGVATRKADAPPTPPGHGSDGMTTMVIHPVAADIDPETSRAMGQTGNQVWIQSDCANSVRFWFNLNGLDSPKRIGSRIFDRRTRYELTSGSSWTGWDRNPFNVEHSMRFWRSTPMDWVEDVAYGPVEVYEMPARDGERIQIPGAEVRILTVLQGEGQGWGSGSDSGKSNARIMLRPELTTSSVIVYAVSPGNPRDGLTVEILDATGKVLTQGGSGGMGADISMIQLPHPRDRVATLRISYRPHARRLVVPLDGLPGMPEENRGITDLLDTRVPTVTVNLEYELRSLLSSLLQVEISVASEVEVRGKSPAWSSFFPHTYTNATAREMLDDWLRTYNDPSIETRFDAATCTLKIEHRKTIGERVKEWLPYLLAPLRGFRRVAP